MAKVRITKVYTKTGDEGLTSLIGGERVSKASPKVEAYGDVDELNAVLGIARTMVADHDISETLKAVQNDLFIIGAALASPPGIEVPRIGEDRIGELESTIDGLLEEEEVGKNVLIYLNRLSDLLFVLARAENQRSGYRETFVEFGKK